MYIYLIVGSCVQCAVLSGSRRVAMGPHGARPRGRGAGGGARGARAGPGGLLSFVPVFHTHHARASAECRVACAFSRLSFQFTPVQE